MKKILVIRFAAIGDCVMAAWPVTALKETYPSADITWAVQSVPAPVIDTDTLVHRVSIFPREDWKRNRWSPKTWREQMLAYTQFRKEKLDLAIDFQGHSKTAILLRLSGAKQRLATCATDGLAKALNPQTKTAPRSTHAVDHFFATLEQLGIDHRPQLPILPKTDKIQKGLLSSLATSAPIATIQTGASRRERLYPASQWADVAAGLRAAGFEVIGLGAGGDPHLPEDVALDWVGKLDLRQCLAAVAMSTIHLAGDTGTGHMAAALGVPVVSVFGMDAPRMEKYRPWTDARVGLREGSDPALVNPDQIVRAAIELSARYAKAIPH